MLAAAVLLAAATVPAGCAADHPSTITQTTTTATATPVALFGGDCGRVLSAPVLDTLVGAAAPPAASTPADSPRALVCTWVGAERSLVVTSMPTTDAAADEVRRLTLPECDPATGFCGGGIEVAGLWIVVDFGAIEGEWEPIVATAINAVARAAEGRA